MFSRPSLLFLAAGFAGLVACASIAGLDAVDAPASSGEGELDGGVVLGDGAIGEDGGLSISPAAIELKGVLCGEEKLAPITITNPTAGALPYELFIAPNESFSLEGATEGALKGELEAREFKVVQLRAKSAVAGNASAEIIARLGDVLRQLSVTLEARGAGLVATPAVANFGDVRAGIKSADLDVAFFNSGNDPVTITSFSGPGADKFNLPTNVLVAPGSSATAKFSMKGADASNEVTVANLSLTLDGQHCGPAPTVGLRGRPTTQDVLAGPTVLDFGSIDCKATTSRKETLRLTNYRDDLTTYRLTPPSNTRFAFDKPLQGTIPKGPAANQATVLDIGVTVKDGGTTLDPVAEELNVELLDDEGAVLRTVKVTLRFAVRGAIIELATGGYPNYADLVDIEDNRSGVGLVTNRGNATTCVSYRVEGGDSRYFHVEADRYDEVNPGRFEGLLIDFDAFSNGRYQTNAIVAHTSCPGGRPSAPICNTLAPLPVSGRR